MTIDRVCHVNDMGVELSYRSVDIFSIEFSNLFSYSFCSRNMGGRFHSPESKEKETSLVSGGTQKAMQYNTKSGTKTSKKAAAMCTILPITDSHHGAAT